MFVDIDCFLSDAQARGFSGEREAGFASARLTVSLLQGVAPRAQRGLLGAQGSRHPIRAQAGVAIDLGAPSPSEATSPSA